MDKTYQGVAVKRGAVRKTAVMGMLSALAFILMYLEIQIPIMPAFIKFDFSDLPALIGAFSLGPIAGIIIELVKNLLHATVSGSGMVGELSNFLLSASFVGIAGAIYKFKPTKIGAIVGTFLGAVIMAAVSFPINNFIVYPIYYNLMSKEAILKTYQAIRPSVSSIQECLLVFNVPFTFAKGIIDAAIMFALYKYVTPLIKRDNM
ncbi:Riboflavin transporter FmnP [Lachnospiraceae bacterium C7]|nr:Riboflavin transporter FmnP [Lachnospiraceae bacterium C7]